jgi:hypothetical protein
VRQGASKHRSPLGEFAAIERVMRDDVTNASVISLDWLRSRPTDTVIVTRDVMLYQVADRVDVVIVVAH